MSRRRVPIRQPFVNPGNTLKPTSPTYGREKPSKPYADFPLFPHNNGQWAKKIRGHLHYFGSWTDTSGDTRADHGADAALAKYLAEKDDLHAGRTARPDPAALQVKDACNAFLNHKQDKVDAGELSPNTWAKYKEVADLIVSGFGKQRRRARSRNTTNPLAGHKHGPDSH